MFTKMPLLLCVDLQNEFLCEGRPHSIENGAHVVAQCRQIQNKWRENLWPIAHLKRIANAAYFNPAAKSTDWVDGVGPSPAEMYFEHPLPSAYSSSKFSEYMSHIGKLRLVIAGFSLKNSIIATIIEGYHRGDQYELLHEAVGCDDASKPTLIDVLKSFCKVIDVASIEEPRG